MYKKIPSDKYEEMVDLGVYAFNSQKTAKRVHLLKELATHSDNHGIFSGDILTNQVMSTPFEVNFHGQTYGMGGVGYVASYPEYRGGGGISLLMKKAIEEMHEQGLALSYLAPFSYSFYRQYGYEHIFDLVHYKMTNQDLPRIMKVPGHVSRIDLQNDTQKQVVKDLYAKLSAKQPGSLKRADWWWRYLLEKHEDWQVAVMFSEEDLPIGYVMYAFQGEEFFIQELFYESLTALRGLGRFITSHAGTFKIFHYRAPAGQLQTDLLADPLVEMTIEPYMMARIVDMQVFLKKYPFVSTEKTQTFYLAIDDEVGSWHHGTWKIMIQKGKLVQMEKVAVTDVPGLAVLLQASIQTWTQLLLGYQTFERLAFIEKISGDLEIWRKFSEQLPSGQPVLIDYF